MILVYTLHYITLIILLHLVHDPRTRSVPGRRALPGPGRRAWAGVRGSIIKIIIVIIIIIGKSYLVAIAAVVAVAGIVATFLKL